MTAFRANAMGGGLAALAVVAVLAGPATAQTQTGAASNTTGAGTTDANTTGSNMTGSNATGANTTGAGAAAAGDAGAARPSRYDLDTPIETIAADPAGKAVLDRDLPGLTTHPMYEQFKTMSLNDVQPMSQGAITEPALARTKADLAKVTPK